MDISKHYITSENARDMQAKSARKRKENNEKRKLIREILERELIQTPDGKAMKIETIITKVVDGIMADARIDDLLKLSELLGEKQQTFNFDIRKPSDVARDILDAIGDE